MGKALPALLNVESESADTRTHNQRMVSPSDKRKSMSTFGENPSQQDAKVQNQVMNRRNQETFSGASYQRNGTVVSTRDHL